jgi:hypothetical protein
MSQNDPAVQAMTDATLAVFDILADRGARSGKGFMRTAFTPQGRRKAIADALAKFVPEGTTRDNVEAISQTLARRLLSDPTVRADIERRYDMLPGIRSTKLPPGP